MASQIDQQPPRADRPARAGVAIAVPAIHDPSAGTRTGAPVAEQIGPYFVYESLGRGGMATVRRAELRSIAGFRRMVALKQLHPHLARIPAMRALFVHEARLGSHVRHANVAQTFDFGKVGDTYFIAMEYVRGPTLAQVARQCAAAAGPVPFAIVLGIISQLCDALDHIHNLRDQQGQPLGIVHRDVSPANLIISNTGIVKLIDFGIAKAETSRIPTQAGALRGKFAYSAPECVRGPVDARSDLFSLGVVAYELIASRPLFRGRDEHDTVARVCAMPIPPLVCADRDVPRELERVVMTALQRDPAQRWQSAGAMRAALADIARSSDVHVGPPQILEWVEWAFSQRARSDADDVRTNPAPPGGAAPLPALTLAAHELSTVVVHDAAFGSAVTREFHRAPFPPVRGAGDGTTTKYPRLPEVPPDPASDDAAASPPLRPSRAITLKRRRFVETVPRPVRARRRLRAPVPSAVLGPTAIPAGLSPMRRRLATATTPAVIARTTAASGSARRRAPRATDPALLTTPVAIAATASSARPAAAPVATPTTAPSARPAAAPSSVPAAAPVSATMAQLLSASSPTPPALPAVILEPPRRTGRLAIPPRGDAAPAGARRVQSTGVVVVAATSRPAAAPGGTLRLRPRKLDGSALAAIASWPVLVVLCAAVIAMAILVLRS